MWTIFKVFIEFVTTLLLFCVLVSWPQAMWDLSFPTRGWTSTTCTRGFPGGTSGKESSCQCRRHKRWDLIPGLGRSLDEGMATHSSILTWRIPWTEKPGVLQSLGSQRVRHDWSDLACMHAPALEGEVSNTGLPGKFSILIFKCIFYPSDSTRKIKHAL